MFATEKRGGGGRVRETESWGGRMRGKGEGKGRGMKGKRVKKGKKKGRTGREEWGEERKKREPERDTLGYLVQDSKRLDFGKGVGVEQGRVSPYCSPS